MKVSVIIPTYNRAAYLPLAIDSVLAQTDSAIDIELIVVDDGSTDGTADLVAQYYPDVVYLSMHNQGVSAARNVGLAQASGQWIALLDSDDLWLPNKLASQMALLADSGLLVCHTEEIWVRNGRRVNQMRKHQKYGGDIYQHCLALCAMSPSSIVIHRSVFDDIGHFDQTLPACEDYDLWLRLAARYQVALLAEPMIIKNGGHDDQLSQKHWGMDRFRVIALAKMLNNHCAWLSESQVQATRAMLLQKLQILHNGAVKRGNKELIASCQQQLAQYK